MPCGIHGKKCGLHMSYIPGPWTSFLSVVAVVVVVVVAVAAVKKEQRAKSKDPPDKQHASIFNFISEDTNFERKINATRPVNFFTTNTPLHACYE